MALAAQLQRDRFDVVLVGSGLEKAQQSALSFSSLRVEDSDFETLDDEMAAIEKWGPEIVVFDGYQFRPELFEMVRRQGMLIGVLDDNGETQARKPDFLINQNPTAVRKLYPSDWSDTRFFLGLEYVLFRDEFTKRTWRTINPSAKTVLVAIGGTDSLGIAPTIVNRFMTFNLLICSPNTQFEALNVMGKNSTSSRLDLFPPHEYPMRLADASFAILGGGSSLYEAIFFGIPTIATVVADNQINIAKSLVDLGLIYSYVDFREQSLEEATDAVLERFREFDFPNHGQETKFLPSSFGRGKEILSREIRHILAYR